LLKLNYSFKRLARFTDVSDSLICVYFYFHQGILQETSETKLVVKLNPMKSPELWNWQPLGTFLHPSSAVLSFSCIPLSFSSICSSLPCCLGGQTEHM